MLSHHPNMPFRLILLSYLFLYSCGSLANNHLFSMVQEGQLNPLRNELTTDMINQLRNEDDWSLLHVAVDEEQESIVEYLLDNGAKNAPDMDGWTPLHIAVSHENEAIVKLFLKEEARVHQADMSGWVP